MAFENSRFPDFLRHVVSFASITLEVQPQGARAQFFLIIHLVREGLGSQAANDLQDRY